MPSLLFDRTSTSRFHARYSWEYICGHLAFGHGRKIVRGGCARAVDKPFESFVFA